MNEVETTLNPEDTQLHEYDMQLQLPHGYVFDIGHFLMDGCRMRQLRWKDSEGKVVLRRIIELKHQTRHIGLTVIEREYLHQFYKNPWKARHSSRLAMMVNNTYRFLTHQSLLVKYQQSNHVMKLILDHKPSYSAAVEYRFYGDTGLMVATYTFRRNRNELLSSQAITRKDGMELPNPITRHDSPSELTITRHISREEGLANGVPTIATVIGDNQALLDAFYTN